MFVNARKALNFALDLVCLEFDEGFPANTAGRELSLTFWTISRLLFYATRVVSPSDEWTLGFGHAALPCANAWRGPGPHVLRTIAHKQKVK